jgi:hypothetical protein
MLIVLMLACPGLCLQTRAVNPPPDGGYANFNTAEGQNALLSLDTSTGVANTAVGWFSLKSIVDASFNTAVGAGTLVLNTADENTAVGAAALLLNTTGEFNTAVGVAALLNNAAGTFNTATGFNALSSNTTGESNTANGAVALSSNTEGVDNTATGAGALSSNTMGGDNTATGVNALTSNTIGTLNTAIGFQALFTNTEGSSNTAIGDSALSVATGSENIGVGPAAGVLVTTADNVICIGAPGANQSNSCYIGNIFGQEVALDGVPVMVDSLGKLGVQISSRRFKEDVQPMDKTSEAILALKPVTFHYKSDANRTRCFGLIAEEVAEVNPDLVVRDERGELLTVRYDQVNAMLLNEFLKEHKKVEEQQAIITQLKNEMQTVVGQLKDQSARIQKVSARLETTQPMPQLASKPGLTTDDTDGTDTARGQ